MHAVQAKDKKSALGEPLESASQADRVATLVQATRLPAWTDAWRDQPVSHAPIMIQRAPADPDAATPDVVETAAETPVVSETVETPALRLIVEDSAGEPGPDQMTKSDFLAQTREAVCRAANEALAGTGRSAEGCPYLDYWLDYYGGQSSQHIERAIRRYAPDAARAVTAQDLISLICSRVRQSVETWARTGRVEGVPEDVPASLPKAASSETAPVQFKDRVDGARAPGSPQVILAQLGPGRHLDSGVQSRLGPALGMDLSNVRVHADAGGADLAGRLNARAFTVGEHIAFDAGEYHPGTPIGDALIAHELAHVAQQRGGTLGAVLSKGSFGYDALEQEADRSAVSAIVSLWTGAQGALTNIAQNAMPRLASGLRLQRCSRKSSGAIGPARLATARTNFQSYNSALTAPELGKIDAALSAVVGDNLDVWIAFYDYYSSHSIEKMDATAAARARTGGLYATTKPDSDTIIRPDLLDPSFSSTTLGTLLIHEFTHTRHHTNFMGAYDYEEGDSYGIEYFLAVRAGATSRQAQILSVMGSPTRLTLPVGVPALLQHFRTSYATMVALYQIIDTGASPHGGSPLTTPTPLTQAEARAMVAELVSLRPESHSARLRDILAWISSHLSSFTLPV